MLVKKLKSEQLVTFWMCLFDGLLEPDLSSSAASSVVLNHSLKCRGSECSAQVSAECCVMLTVKAAPYSVEALGLMVIAISGL